ncbi:MAG: hypothetical protein FJ122_17180 [Deltaproteobacteria bacterium]|nr:hypothetical protein [Deltaproteobacteria bacterium]
MKMTRSVLSALSLVLLFLAGGSGCGIATGKVTDGTRLSVRDVPRMTVDELKSRLNDPSLIVIDVRTSGYWKASTAKIKGALREVAEKTDEWAPKYGKDKAIVLYCT